MDMQQMLDKQGDIPITIKESWVIHIMHNLNSYVRGYHVYMNIWNPLIGDNAHVCVKESGNDFDQYAVAIAKEKGNTWHTCLQICRKYFFFIWIFLKFLDFLNSKNW